MKEKEVKNGMKKKDIERLSNILSSENFKFSKCGNITRIKVVRSQIIVDPIADQLKKARETANKKFTSEEFQKLLEKVQNKKVKEGTQEADDFIRLSKEYNENMEKALEPLLEEVVSFDLQKLSISEYNEIFNANEGWLSGDIPKFLFIHMVDENMPEEKKEEKAE